MRNCRAFLAIVWLSSTFGACSSKTSTEYVPPPEAYHSPDSISDILKSEHPQDFYSEAYGAFRFSSQSVLSITKNDPPKTFQGSSALELDDKGNFHLIRIPLSGESAVELIQIDQKIYLKAGSDAGFRILRPQSEFKRWMTVSLKEVFSLYAQANLAVGAPSTTKGAYSCWASGPNSLCIDPATSLPAEGTLTVPQPSGSTLTVRFNFAPAKPGTILVSPPA